LRLRLVNEDSRAALFLLDEALRGLPAEIGGALLDDLAADYADIYLNYGLRAAPNESIWLDEDNLAMQAPMFEVRALYQRHGLQVPNWRQRADDHLVHELQFLAHLLEPQTGDTLGEAAAFLDEHLLLWLPDFCGPGRAAVRHPVLRGTGGRHRGLPRRAARTARTHPRRAEDAPRGDRGAPPASERVRARTRGLRARFRSHLVAG